MSSAIAYVFLSEGPLRPPWDQTGASLSTELGCNGLERKGGDPPPNVTLRSI